ncbi:NADPH-dependent 7-cyano-7-deazaguanine reductase QueF [Alkalimarinus alittae]|uniref:NADPH-dependent 7-cyano-7-deazaguanine reductase n=1 Tax=Alkalimarinus alittae TaxID=2961619 RepID=A0ABY6N6D5_9ALTE|nr:NADPH-dependent 7-cyano-7-deazaguanine reductase QueF [Alkalimarinus alittae]UZE97677.1 NADPH-dependent 7-cyano-7-deazaguanine reductase QueF [Alkalimarinus alittae]
MVDLSNSLLGKSTDYVDQYSPALLYPLPRLDKRDELGIDSSKLPFNGVDIWNSYELSWLAPSGKPQVALVEFSIPCDSPNIIESKSFKLYLNSLNQTVFESTNQLEGVLAKDLSAVAGREVGVNIISLEQGVDLFSGSEQRQLIDSLDIDGFGYEVDASTLTANKGDRVEQQLVSHLLKTNCPVTGQPDWASVLIDYTGNAIDQAGLLRYIVSYRNHQDFHEQCVERIFIDIMARCAPEKLTVYARYTRRGGLDINPLRTTDSSFSGNIRLSRQ